MTQAAETGRALKLTGAGTGMAVDGRRMERGEEGEAAAGEAAAAMGGGEVAAIEPDALKAVEVSAVEEKVLAVAGRSL